MSDITRIQHRSTAVLSNTVASLAFAGNVTIDNVIVVAVVSKTLQTPVVTDSNGHIYTLATNMTNVNGQVFIFVAKATGSVALTVTATLDVADNIQLAIHEYGGVIGFAFLDATLTGNGHSSTWNIGTFSLGFINDAVVAAYVDCESSTPSTFTAGTGFTKLQEQTSSTTGLITEDKLVAGASPLVSLVSSVAKVWAGAAIALKSSGAETNKGVTIESFSMTAYYEWNAKEQTFRKLRPNDPDPPQTLTQGTYDGEIIEVKNNEL